MDRPIGWRRALSAAALALLAVAAPLPGQDVTWSGQVRPRWELRDPAAGDAGTETFTSLRTRVAAAVALTPAVSAFVQLQDVRVFGEETSTLADYRADALDLHQAFVELAVGEGAGGGLGVRVGRQEASYGGQRLVGAVDWTQQGRAFDGARLRLEREAVTLDLFGFQLSEAAVPARGADATFLGTYDVVRLGDGRALDLFALWLRDEGAADIDEVTAGLRYVGALGRLAYRVEGALQTGERGGRDVSAWLAGARAGVPLADGRGSATLWYDRLSGDADPGDGEVGVFSTLFATNHRFYGYADLFLDIPAHTAGRGLQDLALKTTFAPADGWSLGLDLHAFRAADAAGLSSARFGEEVDATVSRALAPGVRLTGGFSWVLQGPALAEIGRLSEDLGWGFLMLDAAF